MRKIKIVHLSKKIFNVFLFGLMAVSVARGQGSVFSNYYRVDNASTLSQTTYEDPNSGNVGMGTTTPAANLHVVSFSASLPILGTGSTPATPAAVQIDNNFTNNNNAYLPYSFIINRIASIGSITNPIFYPGPLGGGGISLNQATVDFVVDQNGNTGVGTATPAARLDVIGQRLPGSRLNGGGPATDPLHASADGTTPALYVTAANAVGILTATPQAMLDVNGSGNQYQYDYGTDPLHVSADGVTPTLYVTTGGNVGVGIATPAFPLDVVGDAHVSNILYSTGVNTVGNVNVGQSLSVGGLVQIGNVTTPNALTYQGENGNFGYSLYVQYGVLAESFKCALKNGDWMDVVFDKDYKLRDLDQVRSYIDANHHLPDVPSAEDVSCEGIDMAKMDATLLKKIEELTLYVLDLKKENTQMKAEIANLKK